MEDIKFRNLNDLYKRILPALRSKRSELLKKGINYIKEEDIWNYLKINRWGTSNYLDLGDMVNDIFMVSLEELDNYAKNEFKKYQKEIL